MQQRKFPADDPLLKSTAEANEKLQSLLTVIHALALTRGEVERSFFVGYEHRRGQGDLRNG